MVHIKRSVQIAVDFSDDTQTKINNLAIFANTHQPLGEPAIVMIIYVSENVFSVFQL